MRAYNNSCVKKKYFRLFFLSLALLNFANIFMHTSNTDDIHSNKNPMSPNHANRLSLKYFRF